MTLAATRSEDAHLSLVRRLKEINWLLALLLAALAVIGAVELYSVAGGRFDPWARVHLTRFLIALAVFILAALVNIRVWMRLAIPIYMVTLGGLFVVELIGATNGGATRWLTILGVNIQPSEVMKVALVLALARVYQTIDGARISHPKYLLLPLALILVPTAVVVLQPDLGTAILLLITGMAVMAAAGVHWAYFLGGGIAAAAAAPFAWAGLHGYQKARILTFLNPERDPLGAGYHIIQSKIALGSGGALGRGFGQGTQSHLNFVPEKHTDFIFTMLGEEFGLAGGIVVLVLFIVIIGVGLRMATQVENRFGRLLGFGVVATLFAYVFVNIAMVTGLLPVVGVPLPLISYGGTAMLSVMFGFGLLMCAHVHRHVNMPRPLARR